VATDDVSRASTSSLVVGSYYSVFTLRIKYGFDYGVWVNQTYLWLVMCLQIAFFVASSLISGDLNRRAQTMKEIDGMINTADYCLMLTGVPNVVESQLKEHLLKRWSKLKVTEIEYISFAFDIRQKKTLMDELIKMALYRIKIMQWFESVEQFGLSKEDFEDATFDPLNLANNVKLNAYQKARFAYPTFKKREGKKIKLNLIHTNEMILKTKLETENEIKNKSNFTGIAFVVFKTKEQRDTVFGYEHGPFTLLSKYCCYFCTSELSKINFSSADEPKDIIWENLRVSDWTRFKARAKTAVVGTLLTGVCLAIIVYINLIKVERIESIIYSENSDELTIK
jgi:hypothetical protein